MNNRIGTITARLKESKTLREIGCELGITRERVRQLANKHIPDYQTLLVEARVERYVHACLVCGVKMSSIKRPHRYCQACKAQPVAECRCGCGRNVYLPRTVWATHKCYIGWTNDRPGPRAKWAAHGVKWARENPDKAREATRIAGIKYRKKQRGKKAGTQSAMHAPSISTRKSHCQDGGL